MKNLIPTLALLACVSCAPYYVGRRPFDQDPALATAASQGELASRAVPVEVADVAAPGPLAADVEQPIAGIGLGPDVSTSEQPSSPDVWAAPEASVQAKSANMPNAGQLYGYDGNPVAVNAADLHNLESSDSTRGFLVELYGAEVAKNEALQMSFMDERDRSDLLNAELLTLRAVAAVDAQEITGLKAEIELQRELNADLEGRLVTAQIRRLEAEKLLLIDRLEKSAGSATEGRSPGTTPVANVGGRL